MLTLSGSLAGNRATFTNITHRTIFSSPFFERFAINPFHIRRSEKSLLTSMQFLKYCSIQNILYALMGCSVSEGAEKALLKVHRSCIYRLKGTPMQGETAERWRQVCEKVVSEQNPERLMELVRELNQLLEEKETRLKKSPRSMSQAVD
jgi:hypothetical protein